MNLRACVDYNDNTKTYYYKNFEVIDELPKIEKKLVKNQDYSYFNNIVADIEKISVDCENSNDIFNYDFYKITMFDNECFFEDGYDDDDCISYKYVAIEKMGG